MKSIDQLVKLFHDKGLRITPQRRVIFEFLAGNDSHPTADEVYQHVVSVLPDVSRMTVYNTLHELADLGELRAVGSLSDGGTRYDTNGSNHHHLFCIRCHALVDIHLSSPDLDLPPEKAAGYQIVRNQVTFYGICPDCRVSA